MNITEFAAYAGVSKAAVSRYFNGGYLSEEKRARIEAAAAATGYRPSLQAQMLRTRRTRQVLVILPKLSSESCARMVEGISAILEESGYQLLLINTANDSSKEIAALHLLQQNTVDGVILIATIFTPEHRTILSSLRLPVVILGQEYPGFCSVSHDDRGAARAKADPHRQKLHIQPPVGWLNDPNGLCKVGDTYHVFYQYGPFDPAGGVKHWGHVTSTDLLHWQHQPVMLCPDQPFDCHGNYSGSALCEDGQLWLFYTGNVKLPGRYDYIHEGREHNLCLAVSRDCLTADTKECLMRNADYPEGLSCHVRDPKVWRQDGVYYMVLGARTREDRGEVLVLSSSDKRHWRHINTITTPEPFGYMWECPDLFQLDGQWFCWCRPRASPARMCTAAAFLPCTGISGGSAPWGTTTPWTAALTITPPRALPTGSGGCSSAGWGCPMPPITTPRWSTAGSTASPFRGSFAGKGSSWCRRLPTS